MTGFSQPERRGLARSQAAQAHPDADLLNAFSEQTLTAREREQMLAHLAVCPACREVVALAAPSPEETTPEPVREPSAWKWSIVRWGAVAASAVIVVIAVSLGTFQQTTAPRTQQVATETEPLNPPSAPEKYKSESAPAAVQKAIPEEIPASAGMKAPQVRYEKVAPKPTQQLAPPANLAKRLNEEVVPQQSATSRAAVGGVLGGRPAQTVQGSEVKKSKSAVMDEATADHGQSAQANTAPPPSSTDIPASAAIPPPASETVNVASGATAVDTVPATTTAEIVPKGRQSNALHKTQVAAPLAAREMRMNALALDRRWQVTPEGYLLSSTDEGRNWIRQLPDLRFTHVQTIGLHVWACGPNGILMHSIDGGTNWTKVIPADGKDALQGDITSIAFTDINHGTLQTSKSERWVTSDGGKTWKKQ